MSDTPRILIVGYTQSGKSTAANLLAEHLGCNAMSTSEAIYIELEKTSELAGIVFRELKAAGGEIERLAREFLFSFGNFLREDNPAALVEECLEVAHVVEGCRTVEEYQAARRYFDHVIWILRPGVERGCTDELWENFATKVVVNDGSKDQLLERLVTAIGKK